jgi:2,4-dienoyl-CoA reductase (NADPH2)
MKYIKLFEPLQIRNKTLKNRIIMPAMHLGYSLDGTVDDTELNFYEERAKGGVGFIIIGGCGVEKRGAAPSMIMVDDDKYIPRLALMAERIHKYDCLICAQLYHAGRYAFSFVGNEQPVSSSSTYSKFSKETARELSITEIHDIQKHIADAAERCKKAGFDAVELLGSAGYLINQFLSPVSNERKDEYGGSFENRCRFAMELIDIVKKRVGDSILVGMRVSGDDFVPSSNTYIENAKIAQKYAVAGIDYINVTGGWHETRIPQLTSQVPQGTYAYLAQNIKEKVGKVPVFAGNRINDALVAEEILRDFKADAVCIGRALIADPYFPLKVIENKEWDIMKCLACNQGCFDHVFKMSPVECLRNYTVSREGKFDLSQKTTKPKKVLIIGAGPAGLEAARVATILGHDVTVVDKRDVIGGQANVVFLPPGRESMKDVVDYYQNQITHLGINVWLNTEANEEFIKNFNPEAVIFATGVRYSIPPIEGIDGSKGSDICFADDALYGNHAIGKNVVVVGGSATGIEAAIWAARMGAMEPNIAHFLNFYNALPQDEILMRWIRGPRTVTIMEMLPQIGGSIGKSSRWVMRDEVKMLGITVMTAVRITKLEGKTIHYSTLDKNTHTLDGIDTIILATGVKPNDKLYKEIKKFKPSYAIYNIGDSKDPRTMFESIHEGFRTAYNLDKKE